MKQRKGFTLIELLIVIAIIALLALLGGANYIQSLKRDRDSRRMGDLEQVRAALEMHRTDNGTYPIQASAADLATIRSNFTNLVSSLMTSTYLTKTINDPQGTNRGYAYVTNAAGTTYSLCAYMEIPTINSCNIGVAPFNTASGYGTVNP